MPYSKQFKYDRNLLLTILEAGKPKIEHLAKAFSASVVACFHIDINPIRENGFSLLYPLPKALNAVTF